jgi:hypothetical protein
MTMVGMSRAATSRAWLRRMTAAAPSAWHYDRVVRWSAIGAGVALAAFVLQRIDATATHAPLVVPGSSVPANLGPTYGVPGSPPSPPKSTALPKIDPGRSLDGVVIAPAPEPERFGTVPPAIHQ